jgi:hypothetical protein
VTSQARVAAVVVSHNTRDDLIRCLSSLGKRAGVPCEVVVVDNASGDGSAAAARGAFPEAHMVVNPVNVGFARACNQGIHASAAPYVLLLNSDAELLPGALPALVQVLEARPRVGIVGPRTVSGDGTIQVSFGPDLRPLSEWRQRRLVRGVRRRRRAALRRADALAEKEREPDWVSASCLLARREALEAVEGFDEGFFLYEEDVDLCVRVRQAGWQVLFTPAAQVLHHMGRSMSSAPARARLEYHRSHLRYYLKHRGARDRAVLRLSLAAVGLWGWLRAVGPGKAREEGRRLHGMTLRLAWTGAPTGSDAPLAF